MLRQLRKTAGSPESGLPASNINAADGYENQLSATAEIINTSSARGTAAFTLKVNPSLFSCVNISTETSECFGNFIAPTPSFDFGSTVTSSWAVAVLRGQNEPSLYRERGCSPLSDPKAVGLHTKNPSRFAKGFFVLRRFEVAYATKRKGNSMFSC